MNYNYEKKEYNENISWNLKTINGKGASKAYVENEKENLRNAGSKSIPPMFVPVDQCG
jgi:hypothetical protein